MQWGAMEVRQSPLTPEVKTLLPNGVVSGQDTILLAGVQSALVYRPAVWVHELEAGPPMLARLRAAKLVDEAMRRDGSRCAVFIVAGGNTRMQKFVEELGAIKQSDPGDVLYTLTV